MFFVGCNDCGDVAHFMLGIAIVTQSMRESFKIVNLVEFTNMKYNISNYITTLNYAIYQPFLVAIICLIFAFFPVFLLIFLTILMALIEVVLFILTWLKIARTREILEKMFEDIKIFEQKEHLKLKPEFKELLRELETILLWNLILIGISIVVAILTMVLNGIIGFIYRPSRRRSDENLDVETNTTSEKSGKSTSRKSTSKSNESTSRKSTSKKSENSKG
ncbi:unnamed protein product [Caenorhabditis angaria]|uniref:Uncharacterized protein n=1 Tax=Caenorhabditis angaria TaxID=860376 RepID=A0A9P1N3V2_9PELO|nr:unnamed protein product [Caenorhabditis angaria]